MIDLAFGAPGSAPTWCSSDKDFVTTALGASRVWATIGHGIINEVYWPSTGQPQIRDLGFYLLGAKRWIDLKRVRRYRLSTPGPYLPAITVTHEGDGYQLTLEILPDPRRDVLLIRFALQGPWRLGVILAPHLGSTGHDNDAWVDGSAGFAKRGDAALCLAGSSPLKNLSCGYVGSSDGWQDLSLHGALTYHYAHAEHGTVAVSAEAEGTTGILALGFASSARGAYTLASTALAQDFGKLREQFLQPWRAWGAKLRLPRPDAVLGDAALISATVLRMHEDRTYPGAVVASLSIPWGNSTDTLGGYHLVWPRDATLTAFALLAANQRDDARRILAHLIACQAGDGHWPQNYFPNGAPFWTRTQLDEAAFPILLAAKLRELGEPDLHGMARMIQLAIAFIAHTGPSSEQDRWEETAGVNPFTLAIAISALIAAAPWLSAQERAQAEALADDWNERLESWCYVEDTPLSRRLGVTGYYVRIAHPGRSGDLSGTVQLRNRNGEKILVSALVSLDFSYLVRLGLRRADDVRIRDTIRVVDQVLRIETPSGALYHRYNEDGYGEHLDGSPFDGAGVGRGWPLLVGERGHLAMQAGEDPLPYLQTIWNCASAGGLLPEQVWDAAAIERLGLAPGRASGSAMPLLWSHAEFLKLLVAREQKRPIEMLNVVANRYGGPMARRAQQYHWRDETPVTHLASGRALIIQGREPFTLHLGFDGWQQTHDREAQAQPFALWSVQLSVADLLGHTELNFTRRYGETWEGVDQRVRLDHPDIPRALSTID